MKRAPYFPVDDLGRLNWHDHYITRLKVSATLLGFSPTEMTALEKDLDAHKFIISLQGIAIGFKESCTSFKIGVLEGDISATPRSLPDIGTLPTLTTPVADGIFKRIFSSVKKAKDSSNYTEDIGKDLGVIGAENVVNLDEIKPSMVASGSTQYHNLVGFNKQGMEGIMLYRHIYLPGDEINPEDEITWEKIGMVLHSPYTDKTPNSSKHPETRIYKGIYVKGDKLIGKESEILRIVTEIYLADDGSELSSIPK